MVLRSLLVTASLAVAAAGCQKSATAHPIRDLSVQELADLTKAKAAVPVDANSADFRQKNGVIEGALVLSDYRKFDIAELGPDKGRQLVFYCSSRL